MKNKILIVLGALVILALFAFSVVYEYKKFMFFWRQP